MVKRRRQALSRSERAFASEIRHLNERLQLAKTGQQHAQPGDDSSRTEAREQQAIAAAEARSQLRLQPSSSQQRMFDRRGLAAAQAERVRRALDQKAEQTGVALSRRLSAAEPRKQIQPASTGTLPIPVRQRPASAAGPSKAALLGQTKICTMESWIKEPGEDIHQGVLRREASFDTIRQARAEAHDENVRKYEHWLANNPLVGRREEADRRREEMQREQVHAVSTRLERMKHAQEMRLQQAYESSEQRAKSIRRRREQLVERTEREREEVEARREYWRNDARQKSLSRQQLVTASRLDWGDGLRGYLYEARLGVDGGSGLSRG